MNQSLIQFIFIKVPIKREDESPGGFRLYILSGEYCGILQQSVQTKLDTIIEQEPILSFI